MFDLINKYKTLDKQTLWFWLMAGIYGGAILWTTLQSFARLEYSRSDTDDGSPIIIHTQQDSD